MTEKIGLKIVDGISYFYPMVIFRGKRIYGGTYTSECEAKEWISEMYRTLSAQN